MNIKIKINFTKILIVSGLIIGLIIYFVSANLEVEIGGQKVKYSDLLKFNDDNKLFIDASNDTYSKLRDGRLDGWKDTLN